MLKQTFALGAALALAVPGIALANGQNGHGNQGNHAGSVHQKGDHAKGKGKDHRVKRTARGKVCPPGLQKKNPGCLPPGQWRKGDRLPDSWTGQFLRYGQLPYSYRNRYRDDGTNRYLYRDNRVIVVDAATRVIENIIGL